MSDDELKQEEELTVVHNLRSHKVYSHSTVDKNENTKKSRASQKASQASIEETQQASDLAQQLEKLEIDNTDVFEEAQVETEKAQAENSAAGLQPTAPDDILPDSQKVLQGLAIKQQQAHASDEEDEQTFTLRPINLLPPFGYPKLPPYQAGIVSGQTEWRESSLGKEITPSSSVQNLSEGTNYFPISEKKHTKLGATTVDSEAIDQQLAWALQTLSDEKASAKAENEAIQKADDELSRAIHEKLFSKKTTTKSDDDKKTEIDLGITSGLKTKQPEKYQPPKTDMFGCSDSIYPKSSPTQASTQVFGTIISDAAICPKTFSGTTAEAAEDWLKLFERYADYRNLGGDDKKRLFIILLRGGASDWLSSLQGVEHRTYDQLIDAFKETFLPSPELKWTEASSLWKNPQQLNESVNDFLIRARKVASRLGMSDEVLHYAVINGLRPNIRTHVLQQGVGDLADTIKRAKICEAATTGDPITNLLVESMKTNTKLAEQQAEQLKQLSAQVAALSASQSLQEIADKAQKSVVAAMTGSSHTRDENRRSDTRPNRSYDRNTRPELNPAAGQRGFTSRPQPRWRDQGVSQSTDTNRWSCPHCGTSRHRPEIACVARSRSCKICGRQGHFAAVCRERRRDTRAE